MPNAQCDRGYWTAGFRGLHGELRRVRVPAAHLLGHADPKAEAVRWATECELLCARLDSARRSGPIDDADVRLALDRKAITQAQADALRGGAAPPLQQVLPHTWSILDAALAHPSTQHESKRQPDDYRKHRAWCERFCTWSRIHRIEALTLDQAQAWIAHLTAEGYSWDTRRHALLYLRRAARMAGSVGLPDVLGGFRLDRRESRPRVLVYDLPLIARLLNGATDPRLRLAIALGAGLGLRPSETTRLRCGDLDSDQVLRIGGAAGSTATTTKTAASQRDLPVPALIADWWRALAAGRRPADQLLTTASRRHVAQPFTAHAFAAWMRDGCEAILGAELTLPAKSLRKSFATWTLRAGLKIDHVEAFLGHSHHLAAAVTSRHYLADWLSRELLPTAQQIDTLLREAMAAPVHTIHTHAS
jgi:integrase